MGLKQQLGPTTIKKDLGDRGGKKGRRRRILLKLTVDQARLFRGAITTIARVAEEQVHQAEQKLAAAEPDEIELKRTAGEQKAKAMMILNLARPALIMLTVQLEG